MENTTIEQYFILQKIEKVKEWLAYDELTLNEMAFKLGYSSLAHLSAQFKKITGFTPSAFRKLKEHRRKPLDGL
jgi:AraC family transcriptional regulator